jgi:preprotein translocase subunit SecG
LLLQAVAVRVFGRGDAGHDRQGQLMTGSINGRDVSDTLFSVAGIEFGLTEITVLLVAILIIFGLRNQK